ncbi:MAG: hypothetical protein KDE27_17465, partial [Planctomycetes bacterium]|nr:hypothetical protein [Planctomycetota bacterium]
RFPIYVPNSAGFIGTAFDMQAAAVSPQSNLLGLAVSDRGTMTLGARSPFPVIAGLVLHLDAADPSGNSTLPADGSPLATWTDLSGRGNHASTGQASPIFRRNAVQGAPAVDFGVSAVDSLVTASSADFAAATATMFLVARNPVTALVSVAPPNTIDDEMLLYARPGRNVRAFHHTSPGHFTELPHQNSAFDTFIQEATFGINTVDVSNAIDGVGSTASLLTTGSPQPFPASVNRAVHVGRRGSSSFENGSGFIAEVIIYDRILSQQERDLVGSYLQAKFGLAAGYP